MTLYLDGDEAQALERILKRVAENPLDGGAFQPNVPLFDPEDVDAADQLMWRVRAARAEEA